MAASDYLRATRHPWPSFLFLLPLLLAYEGGVLWLGGARPDALRNGADAWVRWGLETIGLEYAYLPPVLVAVYFLAWSYLRASDRPDDLVGVVSGMVLEAVFFALGLWGISRALGPLMQRFGVPVVSWSPATVSAVGQAVTFVGAGIYEEVLFRLVLFTALLWVLRLAFFPSFLAVTFAALGSATLFAAAHHVGPYGEPFAPYVFLFRAVAGLYFAVIYRARGFGVAAGSHALYDLVVGVAMG